MLLVRLILYYFLSFVEFMVFIECICSWIPPIMGTTFYYYVTKFNYPFLNPIRKCINKITSGNMMVDFSPIVLFLIIDIIRRAL